MNYRGVLLAESLANDEVLDRVRIISTKKEVETTATAEQSGVWTWYSIEVPSTEVDAVTDLLSRSLKPRAWFTNLWVPGDYRLIFPGKVFVGQTLDASIWQAALEHGVSIGVPRTQMMPLEHVLQTA